jgi:hypothetical protein
MKRERTPEVHFYEWHVSRWLGSKTRMRLDDAGRSIYRELLDLCYSQGEIPNPERDEAGKRALILHCATTVERFDATWAVIKGKFRAHKRDTLLLTFPPADLIRREYFRYVEKQRARGREGYGKKAGKQVAEKSTTSEALATPTAIASAETSHKPNGNGKNNGNGNITAREETPLSPSPAAAQQQNRYPDQYPAGGEFDYQAGFRQVWETYPRKGRTKIVDSERQYVEAVTPDPERIHNAIATAILPGGKWAESELWSKGMVCALTEFLRNHRWLEDPDPRTGESSTPAPKTRAAAAYEASIQSLERVDLSDVETAY